MDLDEYIYRARLSKIEFADLIDYHRMSLHQILSGQRMAGRKFVKAVIAVTNGEVTEEDILRPYKDKKENAIGKN